MEKRSQSVLILVSGEQAAWNRFLCVFLQVQYYLQLAQQHQQALQATGGGGMQILQQGINNSGLQTIQLVQAPQASMQVFKKRKLLFINYINFFT